VALRADARERYSFATLSDAMEIPNLIGVQRESFEWFLTEGLREVFEDISPVKGVSDDLQLELTFDPDDADLNPKPKISLTVHQSQFWKRPARTTPLRRKPSLKKPAQPSNSRNNSVLASGSPDADRAFWSAGW